MSGESSLHEPGVEELWRSVGTSRKCDVVHTNVACPALVARETKTGKKPRRTSWLYALAAEWRLCPSCNGGAGV